MTGKSPEIRRSEQLRKKAADALRASRGKDKPEAERKSYRVIARGYKGLAENEAWLAGESPRPGRPSK